MLLVATFAYSVAGASAQVEKYTSFKSDKFGFRIAYPQSWEFSEVENGLFTGALTPRSAGEPGEGMMVIVMELAFSKELTSKEIEQYLLKESGKILARMGAIDADDRVVDKKMIDLAGTKAVKMKIEMTQSDGGQVQAKGEPAKSGKAQAKAEQASPAQQVLTAQAVITVKNGKAYGLVYTGTAENFDAGLRTADRIVNTFQFIESPKKTGHVLKITARMYEKTDTLTLTLNNPRASQAQVYGFVMVLPEDVTVKAIKAPRGWTKAIDGDTVTFATPGSPMLKGKTIKFSVVTDGTVEKVDWKALDVVGGTVDGGVAKAKLQK